MRSAAPIALIVAVAENNVIGFDGDMPWKLSTDLKRFKRDTMGKPILMGRKTHETMGRPLPGRLNIIISRQKGLEIEGCAVVPSLEKAIEVARATNPEEVMVIGGGTIYAQAFDLADKLYLTKVHASPEGDTVFPTIDPAEWDLVEEEHIPAGEKDTAPTTYCVYTRK